jgi:hypothetical protein
MTELEMIGANENSKNYVETFSELFIEPGIKCHNAHEKKLLQMCLVQFSPPSEMINFSIPVTILTPTDYIIVQRRFLTTASNHGHL